MDYTRQIIESTLLEKRVLALAQHPFLVGLEQAFQNKTHIIFVMKFVRGGDLYMHSRKMNQREDYCKFYALNIAFAIDYLHEQKVIYRDLKLENVLLGDDGYLLLTDFGISKKLEKGEKANEVIGTIQYLAPEIVKKEEYSYQVDWWTLGIFTYFMMCGKFPFDHEKGSTTVIKRKIKRGEFDFPTQETDGFEVSDLFKDFVTKCLEQDPNKRLGCK